jgi:hypothetical protein
MFPDLSVSLVFSVPELRPFILEINQFRCQQVGLPCVGPSRSLDAANYNINYVNTVRSEENDLLQQMCSAASHGLLIEDYVCISDFSIRQSQGQDEARAPVV